MMEQFETIGVQFPVRLQELTSTSFLALLLLASSCAARRAPVSPATAQANLEQPTQPVYPVDARQQFIEGDVVMEATIDESGQVEKLHVISGPEVLRQSALNAVKKWKYRPVLVDGKPAKVTTTITASFRLR
jgi:protein TonB